MKQWTWKALLVSLCLSSALTLSAQNMSVSSSSFNPTVGNTATVKFTLKKPQAVTLRVYDPDKALMRTIISKQEFEAGEHEVKWDGRDETKALVPDEAYTFVLENGKGAVDDPWTYSGGEVGDISEAEFDRSDGAVRYQLPAASRTLIRLGVQDGPLLKTLVDWKPRPAGLVTEYWDGFDEDTLVRFRDQPKFTSLITYVTLPNATVISFGNKNESYRAYKLGRGKNQELKPKREWSGDKRSLRPGSLVPAAWARAPQVQVNFPGGRSSGADVPSTDSSMLLAVDVSDEDKPFLLDDQFEIIFFIDNVFFAEAERGYIPFKWQLELQQFTAGPHILTVNISSVRGQIGVKSVRVNKGQNESTSTK